MRFRYHKTCRSCGQGRHFHAFERRYTPFPLMCGAGSFGLRSLPSAVGLHQRKSRCEDASGGYASAGRAASGGAVKPRQRPGTSCVPHDGCAVRSTISIVADSPFYPCPYHSLTDFRTRLYQRASITDTNLSDASHFRLCPRFHVRWRCCMDRRIGCTTPQPDLKSWDADGDPASKFQHPVQDMNGDARVTGRPGRRHPHHSSSIQLR
jgi:hypothetical protein